MMASPSRMDAESNSMWIHKKWYIKFFIVKLQWEFWFLNCQVPTAWSNQLLLKLVNWGTSSSNAHGRGSELWKWEPAVQPANSDAVELIHDQFLWLLSCPSSNENTSGVKEECSISLILCSVAFFLVFMIAVFGWDVELTWYVIWHVPWLIIIICILHGFSL